MCFVCISNYMFSEEWTDCVRIPYYVSSRILIMIKTTRESRWRAPYEKKFYIHPYNSVFMVVIARQISTDIRCSWWFRSKHFARKYHYFLYGVDGCRATYAGLQMSSDLTMNTPLFIFLRQRNVWKKILKYYIPVCMCRIIWKYHSYFVTLKLALLTWRKHENKLFSNKWFYLRIIMNSC